MNIIETHEHTFVYSCMETLIALLISLGLMAPPSVLSPIATLNDAQIELITQVSKPSVSFGQIKKNAAVLGLTVVNEATKSATTSATQTATNGSPTPTPTPTITPTPTPLPTKKDAYTISLLGDSMVDTLGPTLHHLHDTLKEIYPNVTFTMHNHGVGGKNINDGLTRLIKDYEYDGVPRKSLLSQKPDIVVVESFGYNPYTFDEGAMETHWLALAYIVDTIKQDLPDTKIIMFSTIAPNSKVFGDGAPGLSFSDEDKYKRTQNIKKYLENTIRFAQSQSLPLANAYHPSMDSDGNGYIQYINGGDHIHYSDEGRQFVSEIIAEVITSNKLLE